MGEKKREFKGVWFPAEVWLDERLTALEKIILIEIDSLDGEDGCYASNEYLAKFCQCSQTKVSGAITKLRNLGYISVASFDGRKRILHSCLKVSVGQTYKICNPDSQNLEERVLVETSSKSTKKDNVEIPFTEIVEHLNRQAGTKYRPTSAKTKALIHARWNEGYTLADFKAVIDVKCRDWLGTNMEKYLRPETLFGTKFENYVNQKGATDGIHEYLRDYDL